MRSPKYKTIVDEFAERIRTGALPPGARLPTVRSIMQTYGIALATASRVYRELEDSGLVVGEVGRGTFVRDLSVPRGMGLEQSSSGAKGVDLTFNYPSLPGQDELLREGLRALAGAGDIGTLLHSAPQGGRVHERQVFARHLRNRGIRVPGEQVLVVNGAQQGLAIAVMALLNPGEILAIDDLSYPGMKALAQEYHLDLEPLPTSDGNAIDYLDELCRRRPVRAVYAMPTLHNPLGRTLSERQRRRLTELAERYDLLLIEDAAYAFLAEPAPPPLFTFAPERTLYVSGFSKSIAAGLRVGYVVAPQRLLPALEKALRVSTWSAPSLTTALTCKWIEDGTVDMLEERKREDARARQTLARRVLGSDAIQAHPSSYYLWLRLSDDLRADQVAMDLHHQGILVSTAEPFSTTRHIPQALRLALGSVPQEILTYALEQLRRWTV